VFDAFHAQFASEGVTVCREDLVLSLGMHSSSGEICWTSFDPELQPGIIRDGDEIRVQCKVESFGTDAEVTDIDVPTSIITMVRKTPSNYEYRANVLLPKTYKVSCGPFNRATEPR